MSVTNIIGKLPSLKLFQRALANGDRVAIVNNVVVHNNNSTNNQSSSFTYNQLLHESYLIQQQLTHNLTLRNQSPDLEQQRVAFIAAPGFDYVRTQWAAWRAGGVAVPLAISHPERELHYTLTNSQPSHLVTTSAMQDKVSSLAKELNIPLIVLPPPSNDRIVVDPVEAAHHNTPFDSRRNAMMIYTSGTTGKPKGCVTTHNTVQAQVTALVDAWKWVPDDRILHILPLHHVHGVINALTCALWSGATAEIMDRFDPHAVHDRIIAGANPGSGMSPISLFMAVPTIYSKLVSTFDATTDAATRQRMSAAWRTLRLMVSGSAALPAPLFDRWETITGQRLLERYGMTEIGMALSNPYEMAGRLGGTVGYPLPGVDVRVEDDGQLLVRGPQLFKEYWQRPDATKECFTDDGYFKTGDTVAVDNTGRFSILGRTSVDIIKSAGYKISALDIERELLAHPSILDVAVIGLPDEQYGQTIGVILVAKPELQQWCKQRMAPYKQPRQLLWLVEIPKNPMMKVNKKSLVQLFANNNNNNNNSGSGSS
ncbi:hypothetical protein SAMD00019534_073850 [Acytostelium subglobosum LB1]|uniref:hypothetical protein n=1 Tax=Acytostelium subglobosum LB1 TaxID=1410327 RepID=UPI0006450AEB|nr:hypothetical protein SAMD00019534_073850 [Acytostelium subglobosum LB1]GAM24210.1 hypothetical protein SAMD00019534_073850 [Acytostelium subglobosum LB1]|eukprot:XP_012752536.1 hypothetical protein SAMD00019534_073850 [Acytostelium subglobosum LB1]